MYQQLRLGIAEAERARDAILAALAVEITFRILDKRNKR